MWSSLKSITRKKDIIELVKMIRNEKSDQSWARTGFFCSLGIF